LALPWTDSSIESVSRTGTANYVLAISAVLSDISYSTVVIVRPDPRFLLLSVVVL